MSVAGSEQWVLSLTRLLDRSSQWLDRSFRWQENGLVLSLTRWLGRRVRSFSRSLCVLSLALSVLVFGLDSLCVLSLTLSVYCVTRK